MLVLLTIALFVALFGVVRPFKGVERKHFGMAAAALFIACLVATPSPKGTRKAETTAAEEKALPAGAPKGSDKPNSHSARKAERQLATASAVEGADSSDALTSSQKNAVRSAEQYLSISGFSRKGLIQQLSSDAGDGYSVSDASAAVDSLTVDWNENAARSARQYLSLSGFSCKGLIQQLSSSAGDKYTLEQATYGARQAGAC